MRIPRVEKYLALWGVCMVAVATLPDCAHVAAVGFVCGSAMWCVAFIEQRDLYYNYRLDAPPGSRDTLSYYIKWRYFPREY